MHPNDRARFLKLLQPTKGPSRREHWEKCIREASSADITLAYCRADEIQNGALLEIGSALSAGRWVYLVTDHDWSWKHYPRVRSFASLADAITAIVAATSVERERRRVA